MAIRNIVKEGDPILNKVCRPVTNFDDRLATLLDDMRETMIAADGVGLAGPQVGMMRRLFVVWDMQDSPLLPPVGVWAVSQSQSGRSVSQPGYPLSARWAVTPPST